MSEETELKTEEQNNEPIPEETVDPSAFGVDEETAKKIRSDILPPVPLGDVEVGSSVELIMLEDVPHIVQHKQKDDKGVEQDVETQVMKVHNLQSGLDESLWLSSKSLRIAMFGLAKQANGQLKDKKVIIKVEEYKSEQYGKCRGYRAQIVSQQQQTE